MATLLGCEVDNPKYKSMHYYPACGCADRRHARSRTDTRIPDYASWGRFPEMQAFAESHERFTDIHEAVNEAVDQHEEIAWAHITPTILRDVILEVCDDPR
jgi:hypothetical protein